MRGCPLGPFGMLKAWKIEDTLSWIAEVENARIVRHSDDFERLEVRDDTEANTLADGVSLWEQALRQIAVNDATEGCLSSSFQSKSRPSTSRIPSV